MSNKPYRERCEIQNIFGDPKYARNAWRAIGLAIAQRPASKLPVFYDKLGNPTMESSIENYAYDQLAQDIAELGKERQGTPTELEMILQCQIVKARYDTSAAVFVRDTLGAKPVDESKIDVTAHNPYENLSDEELELLQKYRDIKVYDPDDPDADDGPGGAAL